MAIFEINWRPKRRQLRQFGLAAGVLLPLGAWWMTTQTSLAGWIWRGTPLVWDGGNITLVAAAAAVGALAALTALLKPVLLRYPFIILSVLTAPIGLVLGEVLVATIYFGIFAPIGVLFRVTGRNPLQWRFQPVAKSYWQPKRYRRTPQSYFQPF